MSHESHSRTISRHFLATHQANGTKRLTSKKGHESHSRHFPNRQLGKKDMILASYHIFGDCATDAVFSINHSGNKAFDESPLMCDSRCDCATDAQEVHHGD